MEIKYDPHLIERLKEREVPEAWPREIIERADEYYTDTTTGVIIAIAPKFYKGKEREIAVSYVKMRSEIKAITIHPITQNQKLNRVSIGRWIKHEDD